LSFELKAGGSNGTFTTDGHGLTQMGIFTAEAGRVASCRLQVAGCKLQVARRDCGLRNADCGGARYEFWILSFELKTNPSVATEILTTDGDFYRRDARTGKIGGRRKEEGISSGQYSVIKK
jgi:hypothetical protein